MSVQVSYQPLFCYQPFGQGDCFNPRNTGRLNLNLRKWQPNGIFLVSNVNKNRLFGAVCHFNVYVYDVAFHTIHQMIAAQIIAPKIAPEMIHQPLVICSIVLSFAVCPCQVWRKTGGGSLGLSEIRLDGPHSGLLVIRHCD